MSSTTQRRSRLQHGYCIGVSRRSTQATAGKGLAQGPCMVARAGVEPTTFRLKVIDSTNAPPRPARIVKQCSAAALPTVTPPSLQLFLRLGRVQESGSDQSSSPCYEFYKPVWICFHHYAVTLDCRL